MEVFGRGRRLELRQIPLRPLPILIGRRLLHFQHEYTTGVEGRCRLREAIVMAAAALTENQ